MKLYSYFRSSAAYRLRIALNIKGLEYDYLPVNLLSKEQKSKDYLALNPQGLVPAMELPTGDVLGQSVALLEWLEESYPSPVLLPEDPTQRARVRSMVNSITCDIHPLCNLSVTNYLQDRFDAAPDDIVHWYTEWMHRGFGAIEQTLATNNTPCAFGEQPSMADICLVPQVFNARRFDIPLAPFPHITRVVDYCNGLESFAMAAPKMQPDSTAVR
jgi:maleylacetoacetate isomerase